MSTNLKASLTVFVSVIITLLVLRPIDSFDVWWHLNSGLWMLNHGQILNQDIWSFTQPGERWINISWLFQIIIAVAYKVGDIWALFIFKGLCLFSVFCLLLISINSLKKLPAFFISFLILLPGIYGHLHLRPHLIELIALASIIIISQQTLNKKKALISFIILIIWANCHASVVAGAIAFSLQFLFGQWEKPIALHNRILTAIIFLLSPFVTPYGIEIVNILNSHGNSDFIQYYISEWLPHAVYPTTIWLPLLIVISTYLNKLIRISIAELFLIFFFLYYSLKFQRFELELCILLIRPFCESIWYGLRTLKFKSKKYPVLITTLVILIHCIIYSGYTDSLSISKYNEAPYEKFKYPSATVAQLNYLSEELERPIRIINDYNYGGYVSLFSNNTQIFIDSRMSTIFPESLLIPSYETDVRILKQLTERYDADAILLKLDSANILTNDNHVWQMTGYDSASVLFIKRSIIESINYPEIRYNPSTYSNHYSQKEIISHVQSTKRLLEFYTDNAIAMNHIAIFLTRDKNASHPIQNPLSYLEKSSQINPNDTFTNATYAYLIALDKNNEMMHLFFQHLPQADELTDGISLNYDITFAETLINNNLSELAKNYLYPNNKERRYRIDKLIETWKLRIIAHIELREFKKAKNCLDVAYELISDEDYVQRTSLDKLSSIISSKINRL